MKRTITTPNLSDFTLKNLIEWARNNPQGPEYFMIRKKDLRTLKNSEKIHSLLALIPAFQYKLSQAAELQRLMSAIKLPSKRGRPYKKIISNG